MADMLVKLDGIRRWADTIQLPAHISASGSMVLTGSGSLGGPTVDLTTVTEDSRATDQPSVVLIEQRAPLARRVAMRGFIGLTLAEAFVICLMAAIFAACGLIELALPPEVQHGMDVELGWIGVGLAFAFLLLSSRKGS